MEVCSILMDQYTKHHSNRCSILFKTCNTIEFPNKVSSRMQPWSVAFEYCLTLALPETIFNGSPLLMSNLVPKRINSILSPPRWTINLLSLNEIERHTIKAYEIKNRLIFNFLSHSDVENWDKERNCSAREHLTRYSRTDQVKFFKGCLPQILLGPWLHTLSHLAVLLVMGIINDMILMKIGLTMKMNRM